MPEFTLIEIARTVRGTVLNPPQSGDSILFGSYQFDSRAIQTGNTLFFALKSENGDGHIYVKDLEKAVTGDVPNIAAVVGKEFDPSGISIPLIVVDDPLKAAQHLATHVRDVYNKVKYIAITGSAGKTTTKEFVFHLLSHKYKAYRSFKNWNNWIGMPFSLLNMTGEEEAAVFELAMSYPGIGEIRFLSDILRPDVAVIINAYPAHLEFLHTVENVARAKSEILDFLAADDVAFINGDIDYLRNAVQNKKGRKIFYGLKPEINDVYLKSITRNNSGSTLTIDFFGIEASFDTPFVNRLHIENLFTAINVVQQIGMKHSEIREAIQTLSPMQGRGEIRKVCSYTMIDETYNSNPEAVKKTLNWINQEYREKTKIAVLGDMLELGTGENLFHREVGETYAGLDFHYLITVGQRALLIAEAALEKGVDPTRIHRFEDAADAGRFLATIAPAGSVILFKGSRGIRLENAIQTFTSEVLHSPDNIAVIGFGKTGKALLDYILTHEKPRFLFLFNDTPLDTQALAAEKAQYEARGVTFLVGPDQFNRLADMNLIILSPGVDGKQKRFDFLRQEGIRIIAEIEYAASFINAPIIAVTGTNGKSTTVSLIHHILEKNGFKSFLTGNIGNPLIADIDAIQKATAEDNRTVIVVELSSYQLEEIENFRPHIGVILNITPDHLDRYGTMENYTAAKLQIGKNQTGSDYLVVNANDSYLISNIRRMGNAEKLWFDLTGAASNSNAPSAFLKNGRIVIEHEQAFGEVSLAPNPLKGVHNLENLMASTIVARLMGVSPEGIETAIADFRGLPHRMETVAKIGNVEFINDSKATNIDAALKSIQSFNGNLVLILGGKDKHGDFTMLREALQTRTKRVLLIGQAAAVIYDQLRDLHDLFIFVAGFQEAVATGFDILKEEGGVVLLAPGCASFDMFNNFEHRGAVFAEEALKLKRLKEAAL